VLAEVTSERVDDGPEGVGVRQHGGDVLEAHARLGEVRDVADEPCQPPRFPGIRLTGHRHTVVIRCSPPEL
jgi:hypothetical protein